MSNIAVVYKSKYGSTKRYANWIAEDVKGDIFKANNIDVKKLLSYDTIVYCGGLYAGGILGFSLIKKNYEKLKDKKLIVVAVGATTKKEEAAKEVAEKNIQPQMLKNIRFYLLRGALNYKKMKFFDKFLMFLLVKSIKSKKAEDIDDDAKGILATYGKTVDFTNKKNIAPVVNEILK